MGKAEDGHPSPSTALDAPGTTLNARNGNWCCLACCRLRILVTFRCVFVLVLAVAVFLSALFWLPFFRFGDHKDLDLNYRGHDIVASFVLEQPSSFLQKNLSQLEGDIFTEMSYSSTKVKIIRLVPSVRLNRTKVLFAVEAEPTARSLIRASFVSLVTRQTFLHLGSGIFGEPSSFEVLKFRGGITVSPDQKAFLIQNVQILFNFTLNFSIEEILNNFDELQSQLKTGLHLAHYENLYISLINIKGSTASPPATVQSQVLLAVGIPSKSRLKQLAQTITGSHGKNLGLNNTVFGRVKQVSLSSILQRSLGGGGSPSPSPLPSPSFHKPRHHHRHHHHHHSHHHHHHHHHRHHDTSISPSQSRGSLGSAQGRGSATSAPAAAPNLGRNKAAPHSAFHSGYHHSFSWKHDKHPHTSSPPVYAWGAAAPPQPNSGHAPRLSLAPIASPPSEVHARSSDAMSIVSPAPSPSWAAVQTGRNVAGEGGAEDGKPKP